MDTEKAKIYLAVLREGSFKAAAEKLGYTTSGISRSIASLEEEVGVRLFVRGRKGIKATAEAEEFLPVFRELAEQDRRLHEISDALHGLETGSVTIGVSYAAYCRILAGQIRVFSGKYPGIEIRTVQGTSSELLQKIDDRTVDLAIMTERPGDYGFYELVEDPMVACVSADSPYAGLAAFPLEKFGTEPMAAPYPELETDYRRALEEHGIRPNIRYSAGDVYTAYCMAEAGLGVSLLNRLEVADFKGNAVLLMTDPPVRLKIGIMYSKTWQMPLAAKAFLKYIIADSEKGLSAGKTPID